MSTTNTIPTIVNRYPELFAPRPIRIPYEGGDEIIHTSDRPFCGNPTCPCHRDETLIEEYLVVPNREGLLTSEEGLRLLFGAQL